MKFAEKYDLQESLTTGAVETFFANDKVRGERVLVHILRCDPRKPNQPTVQWVLEAFRRVAPEPVGLVLEAGPYSGTLYAYLVTKMPDDGALRVWVLQYEARPRLPVRCRHSQQRKQQNPYENCKLVKQNPHGRFHVNTPGTSGWKRSGTRAMSPHLYKSVYPTVKKILYAQSRQMIYTFAFRWYRSFDGFPKTDRR